MSRTPKATNQITVPTRRTGCSATSRSGSAGGAGSDFCVSVGGSGSISDATSGRLPRMATTSTKPTALDSFFRISERGSSLSREIRGGLVTFVTMAYIVVLNPLIIGGVPDKSGAVLPVIQVAAVTALVAGVMTILF